MNIGALDSSYAITPSTRLAPTAPAAASHPKAAASTQLSSEALAMLDQLKSRDLEVRQHEAAHMAAAGGLATSGASFTYQRGPNGVDYAVGGEVSIDTSLGATPEETIERARTIQAAALAPAAPSDADRAVAASAQQMESQARSELAQQKTRNAYGATPAAAPSVDIYA
jgi:hypothetical protein